MNKNEYEEDFYAWTQHSAQLLREGRLSEIDIENIAEEIESMGRSCKRELISRLSILLAHLLKWRYQSLMRSKSWEITIEQQRTDINDLLSENPSLKYELENKISEAYKRAILLAEGDTNIDKSFFPKECPYSLDDLLYENKLDD